MWAKLQFLTLPTADTPGTILLLHFDNRRYFFGQAAEGLQRAVVQRNVSLRHASDVFISGTAGWHTLGGLMGFTITMSDSIAARRLAIETTRKAAGKKVEEGEQMVLRIHGPPNTLHAMGAARRFIFRYGGGVEIDQVKTVSGNHAPEDQVPPTWKDENVQVWAMAIRPDPRVSGSGSKKRTYEECSEDESDEQRLQVVNKMFGSDWRLDKLKQLPLKDVPATITPIYVKDMVTKDLRVYVGPRLGDDEPMPNPDLTVYFREPWPASKLAHLPPAKRRTEAISYLVGTYPTRGKFLAKKATELGVPSGPAFRLLTLGNSFTTADGRIVTPEMVMEESRPGSMFAVLDLPSAAYIEDLINRPEWKNQFFMSKLKLIVWIVGPGVGKDHRLEAFIGERPDIRHIFASADHCPNQLSFKSGALLNAELQSVVSEVYRQPQHDDLTIPQKTLLTNDDSSSIIPGSATIADLTFAANIKPVFDIKEEPLELPRDLFVSQKARERSEAAKAENATKSDSQNQWRLSLAIPEVEIIALGTGSSLPSKYRNVSATLIRVPGHYSYLLDCGENTLGQLQRAFTKDELTQVLKELRMIWISHGHADHHLGTVNVIKAWYNVVHGSKPAPRSCFDPSFNIGSADPMDYLSVISGNNLMFQFLQEFDQVEDYGFSRVISMQLESTQVDREQRKVIKDGTLTFWRHRGSLESIDPKHYKRFLGLQGISCVGVSHCVGARALVFIVDPPGNSEKQGMTIAFSGDCRPSMDFATIGRNADVLIHEATFGNELQGMAVAKKHSTVDEAVTVAEAMCAKALVLTHFSQRYQKLALMHEPFDPDGSAIETNKVMEDAFRRLLESKVAETVTTVDENGVIEQEDENHLGDVALKIGASENRVRIRDKNLKVCAAFDLMKIKAGDICKMEAYSPVLSQYFDDRERKDKVEENGIQEKESKKTKKTTSA